MKEFEINESAFVGVAFSNNIIYNIVEQDGEFEYTGLSIIHFLRLNKNMFIAKMMESQSYDGIDTILDDKFIFGPHYSNDQTNIDTFNDVYSLMDDENYNYFYIYDAIEDLLIVKTPDLEAPMALDYRNSEDVRDFLLYK